MFAGGFVGEILRAQGCPTAVRLGICHATRPCELLDSAGKSDFRPNYLFERSNDSLLAEADEVMRPGIESSEV
eukprot:2917027-Amphidinium_carterae.1